MTDQSVSAGATIYAESCSGCHGPSLEGAIGPSFLDDTWIYGSNPDTVIQIITYGQPGNGMIAWRIFLTPQEINQVAAYILRTNQDSSGTKQQ